MHIYVHIYIYIHIQKYIVYAYAWLCINEMNGSNDIRERMEELGIFCCYKVLILSRNIMQIFESVEDKNKNKEYGQQIENSKYCSY